ncbi:sigma-54-dependent Fis family transcriptional regulator [Dissulfurirhabdus thermomarina]|uniref:Sigma-54-dependent Fis family transcriptional regulator n=1 Tax=Dissulfurirhabdus thermomarina TaxID=1765737 RepID=A0A6N9TSV8_DISTH|nr:sigma-54 dependent transcriptional regulator [Dissulfurirhabdus thermomarina]NDY43163.1 sigma-54-dependent Fis family transcriptional regulator [Dissulfurirhabdus thermomarina]NMX22441.1 sigma-54-dependent Fis family transcriptional regulator [Dissulfurirhabdus thermomarina]
MALPEKTAQPPEREARPVILIVDDDRSLREFLEILFAKEGYEVLCAASGEAALDLLGRRRVNVVLSDVRMPGMDGVDLLRRIKARTPDVPVILITAFASMDSAVAAMKEGAFDYLTKPFRIDEIREVVAQALAAGPAPADPGEEAAAAESPDKVHRLDRMVARSPAMLKIFQMVPKVAASTSSVLITGESGTGKELVARAIHNLGPRKDRPFVVVNCAGIPENLLESELFGHTRGAFTGAEHEKKGLFATAHGGTIFLDEIGELPLTLQVKLLRVVQERAFTPLGSTREVRVDVRIVAATNRSLEDEVMEGRFREDLYYRLNVITLHIPPLRERPEDIPLLVQYFLDRYATEQGKTVQGISSYAMDALVNYPFPGNVRELENIIERSVALSASNLILPESLSLARFKERQGRRGPAAGPEPELPPEGLDLDAYLGAVERTLLEKALERTGGVKTEAAKLLGLNFRSFRYRLAKYGL